MPNLGDNLLSGIGDAITQSALNQVNEVINSLTGVGYGLTTTTPADIKTMEYYLKVKALGLVFVGVETVEDNIAEKKIIDYYDPPTLPDPENVGYDTFDETNTPQKQADALAAYQLKPKAISNSDHRPIDAFDTQEAKNLKEFNKTNNPEINPTLKSLGLDGEYNFPVSDRDVPTQDPSIGKALMNAETYTIVSGASKEVFHRGWLQADGTIDKNTYSTPDDPMEEKIKNMLEETRNLTPGSYRFFIEKLHGVSSTGFNKKGPIKEKLTRNDLPNRMVFPAYVSAFNDSYDVEWSDYNFYGRGEKVWVYRNTQRELTIEFYIISDYSSELLLTAIANTQNLISSVSTNASEVGKLGSQNINDLKNTSFNQESIMNTSTELKGNTSAVKQIVSNETKLTEIRRLLPDWGTGLTPIPSMVNGEYTGFVPGQYSGTPEMLWTRLTFLAQCAYPWYRNDGKMKEQPFIRIRIGDFIDAVAKINRLSLDEYEELGMDLNPSTIGAIPMGVKVTLNMTIVHEDEPTSQYSRFYHRLDFDGKDPHYVPDSMSSTSQSGDTTIDNKTSNQDGSTGSTGKKSQPYSSDFPSPLQKDYESQSNNSNNNDVSSVANAFNKDISGLNSTGLSLNDATKKDQLNSALVNAQKINYITSLQNAMKLNSTQSSAAQTLANLTNNATLTDFSTSKKLF